MTLLEKAQAIESPHRRRMMGNLSEKAELVLSYTKGEISLTQAAKALDITAQAATGKLAAILLSAVRNGIVDARLVKP